MNSSPIEMPYQAGGPLDPDSPSYVSRTADEFLIRWSSAAVGQHLIVIAPRQQGKTSLMFRLRNRTATTRPLVYVSLSGLPESDQNDWYQQLGRRIAAILNDYSWPVAEIRPGQENWRSFLLQTLRLRPANMERIILAIDEIGAVPKNWSESFFCVLHSIATSPEFERLRLILLGAVNPGELISRPEVSPFNVAEDLFPADFNLNQTVDLGQHLRLPPATQVALAERVFHWTSGQPFMTQWLYLHLGRDLATATPARVDELVDDFLRTDTHHLPRITAQLQKEEELLNHALALRIRGERYLGAIRRDQFVLTRVLGLTSDRAGMCQIRCRIYERVLDELQPRKLLFLSYSHRDEDVILNEFKVIFKPYARKIENLTWLDVDKIEHGNFEKAIRGAMSEAYAAVLFVSPHYLNSPFVGDVELPSLLDDSDKGHLKLSWVAVDYSGYSLTPLARIHCLNEPSHPIRSLAGAERTKVWIDIANKIVSLMGGSTCNTAQVPWEGSPASQ